MPAEPPKTGARHRPAAPLKLEELPELLQARLDDPKPVLEAIVHAVSKNIDVSGMFDTLHAAAVRHDKVSELAFAYEHVTGDRRIKLMTADQQASVFLQAVRFFSESFGDPDGAVGYAERAVAAVPGHPEAFARLESLLAESDQPLRLARLYLDAAANERDRDQQLMFLSRAADLVEGAAKSDDIAIDVYQRILRIEPNAVATRAALEQRFLALGRHRDAVKLLEQALLREPAPNDTEARPIRERLIVRFMNELGEPQKAMPHVEALLASDPGHELARKSAEALLEVRAVAPRATAALSDAYEKLGQLEMAAAMLAQELKVVRGARRVEVQRRLAILKQDVLSDPAGALELMAPVVAGDPGDDALRARFVKLSLGLDQPLEAARLLQRALQASKDPSVRARVGAQIGLIFLQSGDVKNARAAFRQVIELGQDDGAVLQAAHRLSELYAEAGELKPLAAVLELVVKLETEKEPRQTAARRLARLCEGEVVDVNRAVIAYRALIGSPWTDEALKKLEGLYETLNSHDGLADILALRAERARDPSEARELAFRSADLRTTRGRERAKALDAWRAIVKKFGPSRELNARLIPLLEQQQEWQELAFVLEREIELAEPGERAALLARLAQIRASRLGDATGALAVFRQALAADPNDRASRAAVEKLLTAGAVRLEAAAVLEPIYRKEQSVSGLIRVLETRAELAQEPRARLHALAEAVELAEGEAHDAARGFELAARGLAESVTSERSALPAWLERVQHLAGQLGDLTARATVLSSALGTHAIDSAEMLLLCRASAEALVLCGDMAGGVDAFRRALEYDPASQELLGRMDELLAAQGSPQERLALFGSALDRERDPTRRRELYHSIAMLQRRELKSPQAALATWRRALEDDPGDLTAHQALIEACDALGDQSGVYTELLRLLEHVDGERRNLTLLRLAEVAALCGDPQAALAHYQALMASADLADDVLDQIEQLARSRDDAHTTRAVLERRISNASEPEEQAKLLERLGSVLAWQLGESDAAAEVWLQGARLSDGAAADPERAARLYERALGARPSAREAAERLLDLYARAGAWDGMTEAFDVLLRIPGERDAASLVLELEDSAVQAEAFAAFRSMVDAVLAQGVEEGRLPSLLLAKARVLASDPEPQAEVSEIYRYLLETGAPDALAIAEAFARFLGTSELTPELIADRRWLYKWRAEHDTDPVAALLAWATAEEQNFGNLPFAIALYERVLELDPERTDALSELARLRASQGDAEGALETLLLLRTLSEGSALYAIELTIASLLLEQLGRPAHALSVVEPLLAATPSDPEALRIVHRALGFDETRARAAELLERASETSDEPADRTAVLEALLSISVDGAPELLQTRRRWYRQLLEMPSLDPKAALGIAVRAAREFSSDGELWDAAERLARKLDEPAPVAEAYAAAIEQDLSAEAAEALGRRMVEFHEEWFEDSERVVRLLERVLLLSPAAVWAFDRLKLAFNATGRWTELFELYDRALARDIDTYPRIELLREAAMAAKDFAGDAERAIDYLERLNELSPGDSRIDSALERLYERFGRSRPLIALLSARLENAQGSNRRELWTRIASLWLELAQPLPAFELVSAMLADDPESLTAIELLERLIELPRAPAILAEAELEPSKERMAFVRYQSAGYLKAHYEKAGRLGDVVRMMEVEIETLADDRERAARLRELVEIRTTKLGDLAGALEAMAALFALEPATLEHRQRLAELAERTGAYERHAQLLTTVASEVPAPELRSALLAEAANVYRTALGDRGRAIELYWSVLTANAERSSALGAARELDSLLLEEGRAAERCAVLEERALLETDPSGRREALGEAARVAELALGDLDRAVADWRLLLEDEPGDVEAGAGLIRVLERAGRWDELVAALERRVALAQTPDEARLDQIHVARVHSEQRADRPAAIRVWQALRTEFGPDLQSLEVLISLLEAEERWSEVGVLLAEEANTERDEARQAALYKKLGEVHQHKTGDVLQALSAFVWASDWERAIEVAGAAGPNVELGRRACQNLLDLAVEAWTSAGSDPASGAAKAASWAVDELAQRLLEVGSHAEVVELLLRAANLPFSSRHRRELRREAACLCSDRLDAPEQAIAIFRGLFAEDAGDEVASGSVTRLALLLEEHGLESEIVSLWEEQASARRRAGDLATAAALWARAAELAETRFSDVERAVSDYSEGAALGGEACLEALARIYDERGEHRRAAEVLEWLCAQSARDSLAERALRLAEAYVKAGDRARARARLEQAAVSAIDAGMVRQRLAELYREARQWAPLADLLAADATRAPDAKSRLALLREAANLHLQRRNDPASAVPLLEQCIDLEPDDSLLRLALSDALRLAGHYEEAAQNLRSQIERYGARRPKDRALAHLALARVSLAAGARAEALSELDIATKIDPAHPGILHALARLAFEEGQLERAEKMYRALLLVYVPSSDPDAPSRAEALLDLGEIAAKKEDPQRALEFVETAFEAAQQNPREAECLERALRTRGSPELLARALENRLKVAIEPGEAAAALADLATLHAQSPGGLGALSNRLRDRARAIHRELENTDVADDHAWSAIGRVYDVLGDAQMEQSVLERRVAAFTASGEMPTDAEPVYRLAELRLSQPETHSEGIDLLERALEIQPELERSEQLLRTALQTDPSAERAVRVFERVARKSGRARSLVDALGLVVSLPGRPRPDAMREGVRIARELDELVLAETILKKALGNTATALADSDAAWAKLELAKMREQAGAKDEALELREQAAALLPPDDARASLLEVARAALGARDLERAARVYQALLEREPADREVWEPLLDVYRSLKDKEQLVKLIDQTVPLVDLATDRARLRLEQATILLEQAGRADHAAAILKEILEEDPTQPGAAVLLSTILDQAGRHEELAALLQSQLDAAKDREDTPAIISMSMRLGALLEQQRRITEALDVYRAVLDWDRTSLEPLRGMLRLSEAMGDGFLIADALEALLAVETGAVAEELASRLVELRAEQADDEGRQRALALGFEASPSSIELRETLLGHYVARSDWAAAARALRRAIEAHPQDRQLLARLIEVHRSADEHDRALEILEQQMAEDPSNPELFRQRAMLLRELARDDEALIDLESAYTLGGDFGIELVDALERAIARAEPPIDLELTLRLVQVLEEMGDLDGARARLAELVKETPRDAASLRRLAALEMKGGHYAAATSTLRRLLALEEGAGVVEVALRLADACEHADRFADARGALERAFKVAPTNADVRARLKVLYSSLGANRELSQLLLEEAQAESDVAGRLDCLIQAGELLLSSDGDVPEAVRVLEQAHALSPDGIPGIVLLARAYGAAKRSEDALRLLNETISSHRGRRVKQLATVHQEISSIQLMEGFLTDALAALAKAFEMDMRNGQLAMQLGQLALDIDEEEAAVRAFRSVTMMKPSAGDPTDGATAHAKADAHYNLAVIANKHGDRRKARVLVSKALSENPEHENARVLLHDIEAAERPA